LLGRYPSGNDVGGNTGLEAVEVFGELALAFGDRLSGPGDGRVFPLALCISVNDLKGRLLEALQCEQPTQLRIDMREEAVPAHSQTPRVVVSRPAGRGDHTD
jgi:hypothetical protein